MIRPPAHRLAAHACNNQEFGNHCHDLQEDTIVLRRRSSLTCIKRSRGSGLFGSETSWQEDELQLFARATFSTIANAVSA